jgi:Reverse transcriptase (RNA-dependent DNA polymerase)
LEINEYSCRSEMKREMLFNSKLDLLHRVFLRNQEQIIQMMGHLHWLCGSRHCKLFWHLELSIIGKSSNLTLKEHIYMEPYTKQSTCDNQKVLMMAQEVSANSSYGLKQSGNVWNEELISTIKSLGFTQLKTNYCCFIQQENNSFTIMIVWVDDILSFSSLDARND